MNVCIKVFYIDCEQILYRLEQERRRQAEIEKQMQRQKEIEQEKEEQRKRAQEQREAARK